MKLLAIALAMILAAGIAHADTRLAYASTGGEYVVSITAGAIRIDTPQGPWQLYLRQSDTLFNVTPKSRTYTRINATVAAAVRQQIKALHDRIEAAMATLRPAQRKALRAALAAQLPGFADKPQTATLNHTDLFDDVANIRCEIVEIMRDNESDGLMCIASAKALGLSATATDTLASMFELMQGMLAGTGFESMGLPYTKLGGLPVRLQSTTGDSHRTLIRLTHKPLAEQLFELPAGFTERTPTTILK